MHIYLFWKAVFYCLACIKKVTKAIKKGEIEIIKNKKKKIVHYNIEYRVIDMQIVRYNASIKKKTQREYSQTILYTVFKL